MIIKNEIDPVAVVAALIAVIALIVAWRQLGAAVRQVGTGLLQTRATTLLGLDQRWESEPLLSVRRDWVTLVGEVAADSQKKWSHLTEAERQSHRSELYASVLANMRTTDPERYQKLFLICGFFETVGYSVRAGYLPKADVIGLLGASIATAEAAFRPHILWLHDQPGGDKRH